MAKYRTLDEFFADQEPGTLEQVMLVREAIFEAEPSLHENLKWNSPNYVHDGEDRITFNLMNKERKVKLLIHMGAKRKEDRTDKPVLEQDEGIVSWQSNIRGIVSFDDMSDIQSKRAALVKLLRRWLAIPAA